MGARPQDRLHALRREVEDLANTARGSDIYVIRSIEKLLHGIELLVEQTMQVDQSVKGFKDEVTKFATAADKSEAIMRQLTWVGVAVAVAQLVLAGTLWLTSR